MKILKTVLLSLISAELMVFSAHAFNADFMRYSPAYYFTKEDWNIVETTANNALTNAKDGQKLAWKNPSSGASGYVIPSHTQKNCRHLKIFTSAHNLTNVATYKFCKINKEWKAVP